MSSTKTQSCKLLSFETKDEGKYKKDFIIYAFGIDEKRKVYCLRLENFTPFIYIRVNGDLKWKKSLLDSFKEAIVDVTFNGYNYILFIETNGLYLEIFTQTRVRNFGVFTKPGVKWMDQELYKLMKEFFMASELYLCD